MTALKRWEFSFRYDRRRGQTTIWQRVPVRVRQMAMDEPWPGVGARLGDSGKAYGQLMEWINVTVEDPGKDLDKLQATAEDWADAEFRRLHPKDFLVD
jgi:hypothetical protein